MKTLYIDKVTYDNIYLEPVDREFINEIERILEIKINWQEPFMLSYDDIQALLIYFKSASPKYNKYIDILNKILETDLEDNQEIQLSVW